MSLYEIENNIHRIITDILARLVGRFPCRPRANLILVLRLEAPPARIGLALSPGLFLPSVYRLDLNPQAFSVSALSQAEDKIGSMLFDGVEKLPLVKPNREDDFFASVSSA